MADGKTRIITFAIGSVILGALVGIGHVLWTRSAESEVVHYSWPIKWALTFAAESPDLPAGSRFTTATVIDVPEGGRWTVAGQVELPSQDGQRLATTFAADIRNQCAMFSERRCWTMKALTFGSVPAAMRLPVGEHRPVEREAVVQLAALASEVEAPTLPEPTSIPMELSSETDEDLVFILAERLIEPTDDLIAALGGWSTIRGQHSSASRYDPVLVRDIQRGLHALGYDPGPEDGVPGRRTRAAVDAFRQQEALTGTAIDFHLLGEITQRLSHEEAAPLEIPAPAEAHEQPRGIDRGVRICAGTNSKIQDCDR